MHLVLSPAARATLRWSLTCCPIASDPVSRRSHNASRCSPCLPLSTVTPRTRHLRPDTPRVNTLATFFSPRRTLGRRVAAPCRD